MAVNSWLPQSESSGRSEDHGQMTLESRNDRLQGRSQAGNILFEAIFANDPQALDSHSMRCSLVCKYNGEAGGKIIDVSCADYATVHPMTHQVLLATYLVGYNHSPASVHDFVDGQSPGFIH